MRIEIDDMYQNVPVKATLESGVTLVVEDSAMEQSFLFNALAVLAMKQGCCVHLKASDGEIAAYIDAIGVRKQKYLQAILGRISTCDILIISNADIFVTSELLLSALNQNPDLIVVIATMIELRYYSIKQVPIRYGKVYTCDGVLQLGVK